MRDICRGMKVSGGRGETVRGEVRDKACVRCVKKGVRRTVRRVR